MFYSLKEVVEFSFVVSERIQRERERLGSVHGSLPCALEPYAGFLEVVLASVSFF
jgi:hypothetical protein